MGFDTVFKFEQELASAFQCIPIAVRYKLDLCGVKLSLRQWKCFTEDDRRGLLRHRCETAPEIAQFRDMLAELVADRTGEAAVLLPPEPAPAWAEDTVPEQIIVYAQALRVAAPTDPAWRSLSLLQRFALLKLSRLGHDNVNFIPALKEFKLLE